MKKIVSLSIILMIVLAKPIIASGDSLEVANELASIEVIVPRDIARNKSETILSALSCEPIYIYPNDIYPVVWGDYEFTREEYDLLAITVYCESGNQDLYTQTLVAKTILNRVASDLFPDTVTDVVYQKGQYAVTKWSGFPVSYYDKLTEQTEKAVYLALTTDDTPNDLYYFRNSYYHSGGVPYYNNGVLYFCTQKGE